MLYSVIPRSPRGVKLHGRGRGDEQDDGNDSSNFIICELLHSGVVLHYVARE